MTYIPGINQPIPGTPFYSQVATGDLTPSEFPMIYTTDGPLPTANGIAFTTTGVTFDPSQVEGGLVTKLVAGSGITLDPADGTGEVTISSTGGGGGAVESVSVAGNNLSVNQTTGAVVITSDVIPQDYGVSSMSIGAGTTSPGSANGGNTFVGAQAGANHGGTGGTNTYIGYQSGENTVGSNNTFLGAQTVTNITSGSNNVLIGTNAGASIGSTTSFTTIVGPHQGYSGTQGEVIVGRNSNFLRLNSSGALAISTNVAVSNFGSVGQLLTSQGDSAPPTWTTLPQASTTVAGIVQLNDSVSSTSTSEALTAAQGKALQDQINSLLVSGELILAGTFDADTGLMASVSSNGASAGFSVNGALPAPAVGNNNYFVITVVAGSYSPTGGGGPFVMSQGDWLLSDGNEWSYFNVGYDPQPASTTDAGVTRYATNAETQTGTEANAAVTPLSLQSNISSVTSSTSTTQIASSAAVNTAYTLATSANADAAAAQATATAAQTDATQALTDAAAAQTTANDAVPKSTFTAAGQIITSSAAGTPDVQAAGEYYQPLRSKGADGLMWTSYGSMNGGIRPNNGTVGLDNIVIRYNNVAESFQYSVVSGTGTFWWTIISTKTLSIDGRGGPSFGSTVSAGTWSAFTNAVDLTIKGESVIVNVIYSDTNGTKAYQVTGIRGSGDTTTDNVINIMRLA